MRHVTGRGKLKLHKLWDTFISNLKGRGSLVDLGINGKGT